MYRYLNCALVLLIVSCTTKNESIATDKYCYPINKIGNGKLFVFRNSVSLEQTYYESKVIEENGETFILSKQFTDKQKFDSTKYKIQDTNVSLIESYWFYSSDSTDKIQDLISGEILRQEELDSVQYQEIKYKFPTDNYVKILTSKEFIKDTIIVWNNRSVECKKYIAQIVLESKHAWIPFIGNTSKSTAIMYYGKDLGMIKYMVQTNTGYNDWELIEIR